MATTSTPVDLSLKTIGPLETYSIGIGLSILAGLAVGLFVTYAFFWVSGLSAGWWYLPFFPSAFGTALWFFDLGNECSVPVGFLGVPQLFGKRIAKILGSTKLFGYDLILSEGKHWLIPDWMGYISVDHKVKTSSKISTTGLSADKIRMTGSFFYKYQVTRPYVYLDAQDEIGSLDKIGEARFRSTFADHDSEALRKSEKDSHIGAEVDTALKVVSENEYGVDIIKVEIGNITLPPELEAAMALKATREAIRDSQQVDIDALEKWIRQLKEQGIAPELAAEIVQTERGKSTASRTIHRYEGLQGIADTLAKAVETVVTKIYGKETT